MMLSNGFTRTLAPCLALTEMGAQKKLLQDAEKALGVGPVDLAKMLETNWNTFKSWKAEKNPMPPVAKLALRLLIEKHS